MLGTPEGAPVSSGGEPRPKPDLVVDPLNTVGAQGPEQQRRATTLEVPPVVAPQPAEPAVAEPTHDQPLSDKRAEMAAPHVDQEDEAEPTNLEAEKPKGIFAKIKSFFSGHQDGGEKIVDTTYHSSGANGDMSRVADLDAHRQTGPAVVSSADRYKVGTGQLAEEAEKKKDEAA